MSAPTPESMTAAARSGLCPELRGLLEQELAAGNNVTECTIGWMRGEGCLVLLAKPFITSPDALPAGVVRNDVNDPHWWKAEYAHAASKTTLACRF